MISKIGISEVARVLQALERRRTPGADDDKGLDESADTEFRDSAELHREGNLDPESIRLIESILEGENEH